MMKQQRVSSFWLLFVVSMAFLVAIDIVTKSRDDSQQGHVRRNLVENNPNERHSNDGGEPLCNGHANLCSRRANEIMYATMHNANNAVLDGGFLLPNHKLNIKKALKGGYRGINMDIGKCNGKVVLMHALCLGKTLFVSLEDILKQILDFLDENPNEVLLLPTEIAEEGDETPTIQEMDAIFQSVPGWKEKLYDHSANGTTTTWPTLQELIATDKRILFFFYRGESCTPGLDCPAGWNPWFDYAVETRFSFPCFWDFNNKQEACEITRGQSGTRDFFGVNTFVTPPLLSWLIPFAVLHRTRFLRDHLQACQEVNDGLQPNLVLVDFWGVGKVKKVVEEINAGL